MSLPGNPLFLSRTSILTGKCWISGINMYVLVYPPPLTKVFPSLDYPRAMRVDHAAPYNYRAAVYCFSMKFMQKQFCPEISLF